MRTISFQFLSALEANTSSFQSRDELFFVPMKISNWKFIIGFLFLSFQVEKGKGNLTAVRRKYIPYTTVVIPSRRPED